MKVDFVLAWVDGNDQAWNEEKNKYIDNNINEDGTSLRYRETIDLRYWFRGVEFFCPWVNKIHFITWGHLPTWLNQNHPSINIVNHKDFIPNKYLPTFSSHTIELNMHRISNLSDHFVYFNDDMFIIDNMKKEDFFKNGRPCDCAIMTVHCYNNRMFIMAPFRNIGIINQEFIMKNVIKKNLFGWFNYKYGCKNLRNLILYFCPLFPGMYQQHLPTSFCKETFFKVWEKYYNELDNTCLHRFRQISDVNQWLMKDWQIASGIFFPRNINIGCYFNLNDYIKISKYIKGKKGKMICINDIYDIKVEDYISKINSIFQNMLPLKSSFEK